MSDRRSLLPSRNQPVSQKYNLTEGYKRFVGLREYSHKGADGEHVSNPVWHDFQSNTSHYAGENWQIPPPQLASGDPGRELRCQAPSRAYREKYKGIFGHD